MAPPMKLIIITFHVHNICKMIFRKKYVFLNDIYTQKNTFFHIFIVNRYVALHSLRLLYIFHLFTIFYCTIL